MMALVRHSHLHAISTADALAVHATALWMGPWGSGLPARVIHPSPRASRAGVMDPACTGKEETMDQSYPVQVRARLDEPLSRWRRSRTPSILRSRPVTARTATMT